MLWSLACNIAKRLLFETNNIASTVNMKPSSFYSISTLLYISPFAVSSFIVFFLLFFPYRVRFHRQCFLLFTFLIFSFCIAENSHFRFFDIFPLLRALYLFCIVYGLMWVFVHPNVVYHCSKSFSLCLSLVSNCALFIDRWACWTR